HAQSLKLASLSEKYSFSSYLSLNVVQEVATLLSQRIGKDISLQFLDSIHAANTTFIYPNELLINKAEIIFRAIPSKNVSYADCISFAIMEQYNIRWVLSFDIHFKKQGFKRVGIDGMPK
ncbi:MAG: PIN domain-containing protein, partial [Candidatus Roizmanbacteria bacterium]|nr:PIN domain-containing protein [Candidatus Roizmanbacteria bacterium]